MFIDIAIVEFIGEVVSTEKGLELEIVKEFFPLGIEDVYIKVNAELSTGIVRIDSNVISLEKGRNFVEISSVYGR